MSQLQNDIAAFDAMKADLEAEHFGQWVVFHSGALVDIFDSFEVAAGEAVERFDRGPYLIRQIGASAVNLPASVMYRPANAQNTGRV
jgi:hypothetical protein